MGISSAPAWFQRFIEKQFADLSVKYAMDIYLDDIMVFTKELEEHYFAVHQVLTRIKQRETKVSEEKSDQVTQEIEFLGMKISDDEIRPHPKRAECLLTMRKQETVADLS